MHVYLVCDVEIVGLFYGTITTQGWRGYSVSHIIPALLQTVGFKVSLSFEICIDIQVCGRMGLVVLKVSS